MNAPTNILAALMGNGPLNSVATKNKGKTAITAIKYSVPDRAMLFSFYNQLQPLWVWVDKTSISLIKLNLHVDVRERGKSSIKGGGSSPEKREDDVSSIGPLKPSIKGVIRTLNSSDKVQGPEPPRPCRGESLLGYAL